MTARTHDIFAFAGLVTIATYYPPQSLTVITLMSALIGNVVGALIPDLDQAGNKLWELLPAGNFIGKYGKKIFYKHRTISHSLLGGYILAKILEWLLPKLFNSQFVDTRVVFLSIMIGFVSHLIGDAITKEGIPLFFPFKFKIAFPPLEFLRITTGSWVEHLVIFPAIVGYLIWFTFNNQDKFVNLLKILKK